MNLGNLLRRLTGVQEQQRPMKPNQAPVPNRQPQLRVRSSRQMQPFGASQEDEYTPSAALEKTGYINPQTTQHGMFRQHGGTPMRGVLDPIDYSRFRF